MIGQVTVPFLAPATTVEFVEKIPVPVELDATVWGGAFAQTIRPFESAAYDVPMGDQRDDDPR